MRVVIYQMNPIWGKPTVNCLNVEAFAQYVEADLIVLPEMFSTGFDVNPQQIAETMSGRTIESLRRTARKFGKAIVGSVPIIDGELYFNRTIFITPEGDIQWYDKRHLFSMGGEGEAYTAGWERIIVVYQGVRFLLSTCYDLRFPVWLRNRGDYDAIICVASWPSSRRYAWQTLLRARAIENSCFVIGANRVGNDPNAMYVGDSVILSYKGEVMAEARGDTEQSVQAKLNMCELIEFRERFDTQSDADDFNLLIGS